MNLDRPSYQISSEQSVSCGPSSAQYVGLASMSWHGPAVLPLTQSLPDWLFSPSCHSWHLSRLPSGVWRRGGTTETGLWRHQTGLTGWHRALTVSQPAQSPHLVNDNIDTTWPLPLYAVRLVLIVLRRLCTGVSLCLLWLDFLQSVRSSPQQAD